jgi:hypothetical protein
MLLPADSTALPATDAAGFYSQSCEVGVAGLRVRASAEVSAAALSHAANVARHMLQRSQPSVLQRLQAKHCSISIIGRAQKTSDIPEHREWALTAQRPDKELLNEAVPEVEPDLAMDASAVERSERAEALASRLAHLPPAVLCEMICELVKEGIISDVAILSALPPVQAAADAAALMPAKGCLAACGPLAAQSCPPPPPPSVMANRGPNEVQDLGTGEGDPGGAVRGAACVGVVQGRQAVATADRRDRGIDGTTRGLGGGQVVSVSEENLVSELERDPNYPDESILVHEFGELQLPPPFVLPHHCHHSRIRRHRHQHAAHSALPTSLAPPLCFLCPCLALPFAVADDC